VNRHKPSLPKSFHTATTFPRVSPDQAEQIALKYWGVSGKAERLGAEYDDTFRLAAAGFPRLLKIRVAGEQAGAVSFQTAVLLHLASAAPELPVQRVIPALDGAPEVLILDDGQPARVVTMTSWLDGELLGRAAATPVLRRELGATLARLDLALRGLRHPGARRTHLWDVQHLPRLAALLDDLPPSGMLPFVERALPAGVLAQIPAGWLRAGLADHLERFDVVVSPVLAGTATQVIHTDFHNENLLTDGARLTGILDFGDALAGPVAMDVGIAACYQLGPGSDLLTPALDVAAGYHAVNPLSAANLDLAAEFMVARVIARIIVAQWNAIRDPANQAYLLRSTPQAVEQFAALRLLPPDEIARSIRAVCED
jgi:Ser/Thr protein kinase RdoA (MazF antagonist)